MPIFAPSFFILTASTTPTSSWQLRITFTFNMTMIEMLVHMDCGGCESKIKKALQKLHGVDEVDIDMAMQKVSVMGWADQKKVLRTVRKTGRRAELWPYPHNPEYQNFTQAYYQPQQQQYYYQAQNSNPFGDSMSELHQQSYSYSASLFSPSSSSSSSSYNYRKHGYSSGDFGYYQQPPYSHVFDERTSGMFSDENPHACSVM